MTAWNVDSEVAASRARAMCRLAQVIGVEPSAADRALADGPTARIVSASDIAPERVEWLWPRRIPLGMPTLFSGDPKVGKSVAALSLAAAVTRGGPLPGPGADAPATAPRGSVILLSAEDDPPRTIIPRLQAAGAEMGRVKILSSIVEPAFDGDPDSPRTRIVACERMPTVHPGDLRVIERAAAELGDCRLIVFDPISAYIRRNADVRQALGPLREMPRRLDAAVVLIAHHNKRVHSCTNGKYRVLATRSIMSAPAGRTSCSSRTPTTRSAGGD